MHGQQAGTRDARVGQRHYLVDCTGQRYPPGVVDLNVQLPVDDKTQWLTERQSVPSPQDTD